MRERADERREREGGREGERESESMSERWSGAEVSECKWLFEVTASVEELGGEFWVVCREVDTAAAAEMLPSHLGQIHRPACLCVSVCVCVLSKTPL